MAESVGKRRSARTRLPSLKAELNESSRAMVVATPPSTREKGYLFCVWLPFLTVCIATEHQ